MQRVTIPLDDALTAGIDRRTEARGARRRSGAVRDLAGASLRRAAALVRAVIAERR